MKKNATIIILIMLAVGLVWYFMVMPETEPTVNTQTEGMMADDGTLTPDQLDDDMIEGTGETGGDFDGIYQ